MAKLLYEALEFAELLRTTLKLLLDAWLELGVALLKVELAAADFSLLLLDAKVGIDDNDDVAIGRALLDEAYSMAELVDDEAVSALMELFSSLPELTAAVVLLLAMLLIALLSLWLDE